MRKISLWVMGIFFILSGIAHFVNPATYDILIPPFFENKDLVNLLAGIAEISLGIGVLFKQTRFISSMGLVLMLVVFIYPHVYFIQMGSCISETECYPIVGWIRLMVIQPLLIYWAYFHRNT